MVIRKPNKPFLPKMLLAMVFIFITAIETLTQHEPGAEAELKCGLFSRRD